MSGTALNSALKVENQFTHSVNVNAQISNSSINGNENTEKKDTAGNNIAGVMLPDYLKENLDIVVVVMQNYLIFMILRLASIPA